MIRTDVLRGIIAQNKLSQCQVAKSLGMTPKTFYSKMKKGVFGSDEIEAMVELLKIQNLADVFFARE